MNELTIINSTNVLDRTINVYGTFEEPLFLAKDVAEWIEHTNTSKMISDANLAENEFVKNRISTITNSYDALFLTEDGLYEVLMQSRKPIAKEFKSKVKQYLKELRTKGFTATQFKLEEILANPDIVIGLATELKKERQAKENALRDAEQKTQELKTLEPKVLFADSVAASTTDILIGDLAKILNQNGINIGQNRLFKWLRENGYLISRKSTSMNMPTQKAIDLGLFHVKETVITHSTGYISISKTTKVTGKGQVYFVNKFLYNKSQNQSFKYY